MLPSQIIALSILLFAIIYFYLRWSGIIKRTVQTPMSGSWKKILNEKVRFYQTLSKDDKEKFEYRALQFLADIDITGIETDVSDEDKLLVAASAIIPIFGFSEWQYHNLNEVLLYQDSFNSKYETRGGKHRNITGMVGSGAMNRMMILSKPALHQGFEDRRTKGNVGIHEFVHLLDKADGTIDGIPTHFITQPFIIPWLKMVHETIKTMQSSSTDINIYGATNEAEFMSVVSEYFFNQPLLLKRKHPQLFELLERIFNQDLDDNAQIGS